MTRTVAETSPIEERGIVSGVVGLFEKFIKPKASTGVSLAASSSPPAAAPAASPASGGPLKSIENFFGSLF